MATAATVFRDYETDGVPSSGAKKPKKSEIRQLLAGYESIINAFLSNGGLIFASKATLDASLNYAANTMAWVLGDATVANNGIYRKIGGSGTGSWTRVSDLPFSFIIASDVGAGTANAIQATTSIPVSASALVTLNIFEANTSSPVTVSFNGGSSLTIKNVGGDNIGTGELIAGMVVFGFVSGSTFRLVSDPSALRYFNGAKLWAESPEDTPIPTLYGGNGTTTFSALHWATKAIENAALVEAIAETLSPLASHDFNVDPNAGTVDSVTISGGYTVGSVAKVSINGIEVDGWAATNGTTVTGLGITTDDLVGDETTVWVKVEIGDPLAGTSALDALYIKNSRIGRDVGDVLAYEDFGGFPTVFIDDRFIFRRAEPTSTDVWDVGILRQAAAGGTFGFVNSALRVSTTIDAATTSFEWNGLFELIVNTAGGGEHVSLYAQAMKNADTTVWSLCTEIRDFVTNPTTGTLGMELGIFVQGTDTNSMRHGIDISIGSADNGTGTNIVTTGLRIGPSVGDANRAQVVNGIQLKGRMGTAIDMSLLDITYSDIVARVPTDGKLIWCDNDQTVRGTFAWNDVVSTWQIAGTATATSAAAGAAAALPATPATYIEMQVNGTLRRIPAYNV